MHKRIKILICLFFIFNCFLFLQKSFAKYVIENTYTAAKINIGVKPDIKLVSISNSNTDYPNYANKTHLITARIKVIENSIIKNNFTKDNIKLLVANKIVNPDFINFNIISENSNERIYEITFTNVTGDRKLVYKNT